MNLLNKRLSPLKKTSKLLLSLTLLCLAQYAEQSKANDNYFPKRGAFQLHCETDLQLPASNSWVPEGEELQLFFEFRREQSNSFFVKNSALFIEILGNSPQLHEALRLALHFLGAYDIDAPALNDEALNSKILEAFVNKGNFRSKFHDNLENFLIAQLQSISQDYQKERAGFLGRQAGRVIDDQLSVLWSSESNESPVYSWTKTSSPKGSEIRFDGERKSPGGIILLAPNADVNQFATQLASEIQKPLVEFGKAIPDQLFFKLRTLNPSFIELQKHFANLKAISKKAGIFDSFDPSVVKEALETADPQKRQAASKNIISKLLNSSEFFSAYAKFGTHYVKFGSVLTRELKNGFFKRAELEFFEEIFRKKLVLMSMELVNMGVDFQTVSPRYKEVNRYIGAINNAMKQALKNAMVVDQR
ncbi:hypothetical protein GW915_09305 [bacterium]|nr:hypothetical protein [bacterium]